MSKSQANTTFNSLLDQVEPTDEMSSAALLVRDRYLIAEAVAWEIATAGPPTFEQIDQVYHQIRMQEEADY